MPEFKQDLYEESLDILLSANVPRDIAEAASKIFATDDSTQPDLGRTAQDTEVVEEAKKHYWREQANHWIG
jgi:hypothetical protein